MNGRKTLQTVLFYGGIVLMASPFITTGTPWFAAGLAAAAIAVHMYGRTSSRRARWQGRLADLAMRHETRLLVMAAILSASLPFGLSDYYTDVFTLAMLYAMLAVALNITVGYTGVFVMGFIAFYAIGAYTMGLLTTKYHLMGFWPALPLCGLFSMAAGLLLGFPTLRLKGDYLAIVTLGFGEIVRLLLNNLDSFTGGPNGISGIPRPSFGPFVLDGVMPYYFFCLAMLVTMIVIVRRLERSRFGRSWIAIRENELAAGVLGIDVFRKYLLSFSISSFLGGIAGALFASKQGFVSPESFTFFESVLVLCMVVIGGIGSIPGSVLGALMLIVLPEMLREFALYRMLLFGTLIIAFMVFRPSGIMGGSRIALEMRDGGVDAED